MALDLREELEEEDVETLSEYISCGFDLNVWTNAEFLLFPVLLSLEWLSITMEGRSDVDLRLVRRLYMVPPKGDLTAAGSSSSSSSSNLTLASPSILKKP